MSMPARLRLYTRAGCHLCDEMLRDLEAFRRTGSVAFTVEIQDIDLDPETQRRYSLRIPVLTALDSGKVLCESRFNRQTVVDYLVAGGC